MNNTKISSHPPVKKQVEEFILGAEQRRRDDEYGTTKQKIEPSYPWNESTIRADVQKVFTVKLPEEYILKIKYISDTTNKSQQKIVREIVCQEIDKLINSYK